MGDMAKMGKNRYLSFWIDIDWDKRHITRKLFHRPMYESVIIRDIGVLGNLWFNFDLNPALMGLE